MARIGVIFPGQGSQVVGMGVDLAAAYPVVADLFRRAERVLGYDLLQICREGPEETLRETRYSQPAIFVVNCALRAAVGDALAPSVSAGHSFGEYCSLHIAGALGFEEALGLVAQRALAMHDAAKIAPGAMAAVLGLAPDVLREVVASVVAAGEGRVQLANFNAPGQIVISGDRETVRVAGDLAMEKGAKRVIPLNVSGAWHSTLMEPAVGRFAPFVREAAIAMPQFTVISNVDAKPYTDVETIRQHLVDSVTHEVLWHDAALALLATGVDLVVEFGASAVLAPMMRRLPNAPQVVHAGDAAGVEKVRNLVGTPAAR